MRDEIVQRVFIAFEFENFEAVGNACFGSGRFTVFPVLGIDDFQYARFCHGIEVFPLFNQNIFSSAFVLAVQIKHGMSRSTAATEIVEHNIFRACATCSYTVFNRVNALWI